MTEKLSLEEIRASGVPLESVTVFVSTHPSDPFAADSVEHLWGDGLPGWYAIERRSEFMYRATRIAPLTVGANLTFLFTNPDAAFAFKMRFG